ncbi:charged multivesicular body protein 4b [Cimex lectularius]|uniref:Charged multivesicular body protein 4b n=1 Tax=Cimex lectularius TaxID=79782 RepID=A0A8I6TDM5_CIMLE|nr:charged multivesicular body protein 4b [Cimex lectularius]
MSFFSKVFGGKKDDKVPTASEAIQKLRETEEMLVKKQEFLEKKIDQELAIVKKNGTHNKRVALQALRRKKRYERQLQQIDGTLSTIEMQRESLESANTNTAILQTMKLAADTLKNTHQQMDVDQVHEMMDDIAEQHDVAKEISGAISNPISFGNDIDEDELERELEELEQEELDRELLGTGPTPTADQFPQVPQAVPATAKPKAKVSDEDEDLKQLEQWAT